MKERPPPLGRIMSEKLHKEIPQELILNIEDKYRSMGEGKEDISKVGYRNKANIYSGNSKKLECRVMWLCLKFISL